MNPFAFEKNKFFAPLGMEVFFGRRRRGLVAASASIGILASIALVLFAWIHTQLILIPALPIATHRLVGVILVLLGLRLFVLAIDRFIASTTYDKRGSASSRDSIQRLNFCAATLWFYGIYGKNNPSSREFLASLLRTDIGAAILMRLGVSPEELRDFLAKQQGAAVPLDQALEALRSATVNREITAGDLLVLVFNQDRSFRDFAVAKQADEQALRGVAQWIERRASRDGEEKKWWSREILGRIPGLAKTWSYGPVFTLMKFAARVESDTALLAPVALIGRENEIKLLEDALLGQKNANTIVVGEPGAGKENLILGLTQMILQGKVFPELESKRMFTLAGPAVVATGKTKGDIEAILITILNEAAMAGDVILVMEQFPEFVESLEKMGIIAAQILEPYLRSNTLHIIALADTTPFRKFVEGNAALMAHFEKIEVLEPDEARLLAILQDAAPSLEAQARNGVFFTYPALKKIAEAGVRYLVQGALPERALNLMQELINHAALRASLLIGPEMVAEYIGKKTKMPLGTITKDEQDMLMNLEDRLHEHVIDQTEAIRAIANTVRRARAGVGEPKRPIGSFLFLGPTGVGKTETAKALALVYFGNEETMTRLDMTEYQTEGAIERLIGSFEKNEPGILASRMRSSPYGAILLDEFEKADKKVVDLFLQILDEGFFSDAFGKRVNMRNTIIIATSNAGSQLIWQWVQAGTDPATKKAEIVSQIQQEGKFKPELLNRFDAIIIYQPLSPEHLKEVAKLMLKKLARRLQEQQSITLSITSDLVEEAVRQGYDPTFGARPMRRFIQDKIEKIIAEKIIKGEIIRGGSIALETKDIL